MEHARGGCVWVAPAIVRVGVCCVSIECNRWWWTKEVSEWYATSHLSVPHRDADDRIGTGVTPKCDLSGRVLELDPLG